VSQHIATVERYYAARAREYEITSSYSRPTKAALLAPIRARYQFALEGHDVLEVACGPGYWTEAVALTARSVFATDRDPNLVSMARRRLAGAAHVRCDVADAYSLNGVPGPFTAAFANFWWSHISIPKLNHFLAALHSKLLPGALVMFMDETCYYSGHNRRLDGEGNLLEERILQNGDKFEIIKNFPDESEIASALNAFGDQVVYKKFAADGYWTVSYRTRSMSGVI
jgi:SAM-dependent methyltransferase